jgi:hypothetical protein
MSNVLLYMSMSVDGFITGPDHGMDHGLGVNGERMTTPEVEELAQHVTRVRYRVRRP